jgi:protein SDA1
LFFVLLPAFRVVGVHKLLLLNFYPFLQKYIAPHQRDVTAVLAALVQAVHELVPPDSLAPVLRQLVDQFVHDRSVSGPTCLFHGT